MARKSNGRRKRIATLPNMALAGLAVVTLGVVGFAVTQPNEPVPASPQAESYLASPPPVATPKPAAPLPAIEASVKTQGKPDGPLTVTDTGQPIVNFGEAPGAVLNGAWQHNVDGFKAPAAYAQVELPGDVTRIGAAARFPVGAAKAGNIALVIPSESWASGKGWKSGVHFVAKGSGEWNVTGYSDGKAGPVYASGTAPSFLDGREVRFDILVNRAAGTVTVILPDGSRYTATNGLITADSSRFAIFELYETSAASTPAVITEMWAGSK